MWDAHLCPGEKERTRRDSCCPVLTAEKSYVCVVKGVSIMVFRYVNDVQDEVEGSAEE